MVASKTETIHRSGIGRTGQDVQREYPVRPKIACGEQLGSSDSLRGRIFTLNRSSEKEFFLAARNTPICFSVFFSKNR